MFPLFIWKKALFWEFEAEEVNLQQSCQHKEHPEFSWLWEMVVSFLQFFLSMTPARWINHSRRWLDTMLNVCGSVYKWQVPKPLKTSKFWNVLLKADYPTALCSEKKKNCFENWQHLKFPHCLSRLVNGSAAIKVISVHGWPVWALNAKLSTHS